MPITSGSIEYERRLNLGEYNHKNVVAKVSWTVEPGEDEVVLGLFAVDKVVMRVKDVLNWKPAVPDDMLVLATEIDLENKAKPEVKHPWAAPIDTPNLENLAAPNLAAQHPVAEITAGIPPALKRHRRTKAEMEAARAAETDPTQTNSSDPSLELSEETFPTSSATTAKPGRTKAELAAAVAAAITAAEARSGLTPEPEPGMPSFDPDPEPPAEVTDQALLDACQAKASSGKPVADIKELVAKFSAGGLVQTPQDARRRFLDDLAKL